MNNSYVKMMIEKYGRLDILSQQLELRQILLNKISLNKSTSAKLSDCLQQSLYNDIKVYKKDAFKHELEQLQSANTRKKKF